MKERTFIISVVVVVAVFVGTTVAIQSNNAPAIRQLAEQQSKLVTLLRKMDVRMAEVKGGGVAMMPQGNLEARIAALDAKVSELLNVYKKFDQQAQAQRQAPPQEDLSKVYEIPTGPSTVKGKKDAPVTIVSFLDLQCPFSARFQPVIDAVLEAYPDKVKGIMKHFPLNFHQMAKPAGKAVLAAGEQGKYWEMMDLVLKNNRDLSDAKFEEFAKQLGLNLTKFKASYEDKDGKWEKLIQDDYDLGMQVDVRGTPTYYLNGRKTSARDVEKFKAEIEEILNKQP